MRICQHYFCSARFGDIAIHAYRKSAFGGRPGEPWPKEAICPRCGAKAFDADVTKGSPGYELSWEWQSIIHGYHERYLREHPELSPLACDHKPEQLDGARIYLYCHGRAVDVTAKFRAV
jgi:hypothetical protein